MRAETHDRLPAAREPRKFPVLKLLIAVLIVLALLLFWYFSGGENTSDAQVSEPIVAAQPLTPAVVPAPDIPDIEEPTVDMVTPPDDAPEETLAPVVVLPSVEESDAILRVQLDLAGADERFDKLITHDHPVDLTAALIDGASRGVILRKIIPAEAPRQAFSVQSEGDMMTISRDSYARYDSYTDSLTALDNATLIATFHSMRPLYERAYEQLGLDPNDFDNAIIRTLDLILAAPELEQPPALKREKVMYTYADPQLEALPMLQKQLLRMGPENTRRIKAKAKMLREGLLKP